MEGGAGTGGVGIGTSGTEPLSGGEAGADAAPAAGGRRACPAAATLSTEAAVVAYGAGSFLGGAAGIFRSTSRAADADGIDIGVSGSLDILNSNGKRFELSRWRDAPFFGPHGTLAGDLDLDGKADLVALGDNSVTVIRAAKCGFDPDEQWAPHGFYGQYGTFIGDIDGDQRADLVGLGWLYIGVLRSTGAGFAPYEGYPIAPFYCPYGHFLADVDGDGKGDVIGLADGYVGVFRSAAKACSGLPSCATEGFPTYEEWSSATLNGAHGSATGDVNGDGYADIATFDTQMVAVGLSNGVDSFSYAVWSTDALTGPNVPLLADVNDDGKSDVVIVTGTSVSVRLSSPVGRGIRGTHFDSEQIWFSGPF